MFSGLFEGCESSVHLAASPEIQGGCVAPSTGQGSQSHFPLMTKRQVTVNAFVHLFVVVVIHYFRTCGKFWRVAYCLV